MSIYATWLCIDDEDHELGCGRLVEVPETDPAATIFAFDGRSYRDDKTRKCTCGNQAPIVYQGSHVNPADDDPRGGFVMTCAIPNHCHPSARGTDSDGAPVQFLRLSVREDPATYHGGEPGDATVVLDLRQVVALHDMLSKWLEAEDPGVSSADYLPIDHGPTEGEPVVTEHEGASHGA